MIGANPAEYQEAIRKSSSILGSLVNVLWGIWIMENIRRVISEQLRTVQGRTVGHMLLTCSGIPVTT